MDRRKAIYNLSLGTAGLGFSSAFISVLTSCENTPELNYAPLMFNAKQDALVQQLVELIIPTTDTPGAKAAQVNQYIDKILTLVKQAPEVQIFMDGLASLEAQKFTSLDEEEQVAILKKLEAESKAAEGLQFFTLLKNLTIRGYYTSEIGASQELSYVHATGVYNGDMPYSEVGKNYY